jgi:hypothetical protein
MLSNKCTTPKTKYFFINSILYIGTNHLLVIVTALPLEAAAVAAVAAAVQL